MEREGVAVAPGAFFGSADHFRVSLGGAPEKLERGLDAIARTISEP